MISILFSLHVTPLLWAVSGSPLILCLKPTGITRSPEHNDSLCIQSLLAAKQGHGRDVRDADWLRGSWTVPDGTEIAGIPMQRRSAPCLTPRNVPSVHISPIETSPAVSLGSPRAAEVNYTRYKATYRKRPVFFFFFPRVEIEMHTDFSCTVWNLCFWKCGLRLANVNICIFALWI